MVMTTLTSAEQAARRAIAEHAANPNAHGTVNGTIGALTTHNHTGGSQGQILERGNLTGTQTADTISDFQAAVSLNEDVIAALNGNEELTDGGETNLHYHDADRARVNHTGTQAADTISDPMNFGQILAYAARHG